ncbi:Gfo/Idh/MocA family protein [Pararhizobium sp.]|uniref:Gfo/Idh/MocA family protein n=1 Tax=Pararhizobium sp. TaxID=1977563 RepID=UPI0027260C22|nr:Gfo/Idh/MocA family oxidoreductase [Pararhizobium sp.]MDO9414869.1 Gfo/Idh/MocA family oxidoreductase [Pararhizobium sp.]
MDEQNALTGNDSPVRWAIVGTGTIAATFADDISLAGNARLAAVCSRRLQTAEAFAARFGGARCFEDLQSLANDPGIDIVYLATPNHVHFEQAKLLLESGKHVLVEKPLTTTAQEAAILFRLARAKNLFLMEALWTLLLPALAHVRAYLLTGKLGAIRSVRANLSYEKPYDPHSKFFNPAMGGGSLLDLGVYPLSIATNLFGRPRHIAGSWRAAPSGVDMAAQVSLGYDYFFADIACGFDHDGTNQFVISGEKSSLVIDAPFLKAQRILSSGSDTVLSWLAPETESPVRRLLAKAARRLPGAIVYDAPFAGNGLQFEIAAAGDALRRGEHTPALWTASNSSSVLEIIETIKAQPPLTSPVTA